MLSLDVICSGAILALTILVLLGYAARALAGARKVAGATAEKRPGLPAWVKELSRWALEPIVLFLIRAGISASAITTVALFLGAVSGVLLATGHFGVAGVTFVIASIGDTLDGQVARKTQTASPAGALYDASVDRYEEFFSLFGIATFFRDQWAMVVLVFFALLGSFMVSYGSAKAEGFRVTVPPGWMRRAERAVVVAVGTILAPLSGAVGQALGWPTWAAFAPVWLAVGLVAVVANVSAVARLRAIAAVAVSAKAPSAISPSASTPTGEPSPSREENRGPTSESPRVKAESSA